MGFWSDSLLGAPLPAWEAWPCLWHLLPANLPTSSACSCTPRAQPTNGSSGLLSQRLGLVGPAPSSQPPHSAATSVAKSPGLTPFLSIPGYLPAPSSHYGTQEVLDNRDRMELRIFWTGRELEVALKS